MIQGQVVTDDADADVKASDVVVEGTGPEARGFFAFALLGAGVPMSSGKGRPRKYPTDIPGHLFADPDWLTTPSESNCARR